MEETDPKGDRDERLLSLERELRKTKAALLFVVFVFSVIIAATFAQQFVGLGRQARFGTVVAEHFVLAKSGNPRATLGVSTNDSAAMTFYSPEGRSRAAVMVDKEGNPSVGLTGPKGKLQSLLTVDEKGPKFAFYDDEGQERMSMVANEDGFPGLYIYDQAGKNRLRLLVADSGERSYAVLGVNDGKGATRLMLSVDDQGKPMLNFYNRNQERYGSLYVEDQQGRPLLYLTDRNGKIVWEAQ